MLTLKVFGKFCVVDQNGQNKTPGGQKAKGLLVLLASSPDHSRSRLWLQDQLWSDRSRGQAAGSLRTCLNEIRKAFGENQGALSSDRINVSLTPGLFKLDYEVPSGAISYNEAFEDIDIRDSEFEHTIRDIRANVKAQYIKKYNSQNNPSAPIVDLVVSASGGLLAEVVAEALVNRITSTLNINNGISTIVRRAGDLTSTRPFTTCRMKFFEVNNEVYVSSRVLRASDGAELWSDDLVACGPPSEILDCVNVGRLALQTIDKISDALIQHDERLGLGASAVYSLEAQGIQLLFKLDKSSLKEADKIFSIAYERSPQGHYLAWRAFLRNLAFFQHRTTDFLNDQTTTLEFSYEAVRESPEHPLVLGIGSQLDYIHQGDLATSLAIADKAVQKDATNPLTWAFYSNALVANKRHKEGMGAAEKAISLSKGSRQEFFFHHFACMASVSQLDYQKGMSHAQTALRFRPDFVSTRRYELAISTELNESNSFEQSLEMMKKYETDFTAKMLLDPNYPVTTMRRLPLIDSVNSYLGK